MAMRRAEEYIEVISPEGYVSNREITNLPGHFLVRGSQNTRIVNKEKVVASKRFTLQSEAKTVNNGIRTSDDWLTNTGVYRNIKGYRGANAGTLKFWYEGAWELLKDGFNGIDFDWTYFWSSTEQLDLLIGVNGTDQVHMWSGGVTRLKSATSNTITKRWYLSGTTFAFVAASGSDNAKITDSGSGFLTAGFSPGQQIRIAGSTSGINDGLFTIKNVVAGEIELQSNDILTTQAAGATVIITDKTEGTWAEARFLTAGTRQVLINGTVYTYTGGQDTGTLTGVTPDPSGETADSLVVQNIVTSSPATLDGIKLEIVETYNNHVLYASRTSREIYMAAIDDYTDFAKTTPLRKPGEGETVTVDAAVRGLVSDENVLYISAGDDDWYQLETQFSDTLGGEEITVRKLKTSPGQAAVNQNAIAKIKNNIGFLSVERTFDTLGSVENIETRQSRALSDDIRDDMERYDITNAHVLYFRRSVFIALPVEGVLLEYDMRFGYWQPPQLLPIARLAIIDDELCGHSSNSDETYKLYTGTSDNGAPFTARAVFGYDNFGSRFSLKNFTEIATELYISRNTKLTTRILYDYQGASGVQEFVIDGDHKPTTFQPVVPGTIGSAPLGSQPFGSTSEEVPVLVKSRTIFTTLPTDFFERQRVFESSSEDCQFEIIAFGENAVQSDNEPNFIKQ